MATLAINVPGRDVMLSTEHAASSYGVPVLVEDGRAYGPADPIDAGQGKMVPAAHLVKTAGIVRGRPGDLDGDADQLIDAAEAGWPLT